MASGPALYVVRVEHRVSSLQLLCQQAIASTLREDKDVSKLTLPPRLCSYLSTAFIPTIKVESSHPFPSSFLLAFLPETGEILEVAEVAQRLLCFPMRVPHAAWGWLHGLCRNQHVLILSAACLTGLPVSVRMRFALCDWLPFWPAWLVCHPDEQRNSLLSTWQYTKYFIKACFV